MNPSSSLASLLPAAGADIGGNRLTFFALTSKPELQIRDALAWQMHQRLGETHVVSREWKRTDLAILDASGNPEMLLEAKAMFTFDVVTPAAWEKYVGFLRADRAKASKLAVQSTSVVLLLLVTHVADPVPDRLSNVVKYAPRINRSLRERGSDELEDEAQAVLRGELPTLGSKVNEIELGNGTAFGLSSTTTAYVID